MVSRAIGPGNGCLILWHMVWRGTWTCVFRCTKMTLILYAARFLGIHWLLENPSQSLVGCLNSKFIFKFLSAAIFGMFIFEGWGAALSCSTTHASKLSSSMRRTGNAVHTSGCMVPQHGSPSNLSPRIPSWKNSTGLHVKNIEVLKCSMHANLFFLVF